MNLSVSDLAKSRHRDQWLHHPVVGDPSWDAFEREAGNPIYTGKPPYLFRDPPSGRWYAYISLYPRGYWPPGGTLCLRERAAGGWEEMGIVLHTSFDGDGTRPGGTVDVSMTASCCPHHVAPPSRCFAGSTAPFACSLRCEATARGRSAGSVRTHSVPTTTLPTAPCTH